MAAGDEYSVRDYGRMLTDAVRTRAWVEALRRAVRPGSVVLDIGTGPGYFALLACRFGAARVYAVEPDETIEIGRESAQRLGLGDRITWLRALSTEIELPERVDVVFGDLHGMLPFYRGNLTSMIDARNRHLRPGGRMIPARDVVYAAPTEAADEYRVVLEPWQHNLADVDLSAGRRYIVNQWWRAATPPISAERFIASPLAWAEIDYQRLENPNVSGHADWIASRAGVLHGYYFWFEGEPGDDLRFSNSPTLPERVYGRAFLPLEQPVTVKPGDRIRGDFSANMVASEYVLRWRTCITDAGGTRITFDQSDFAGHPRPREDLQAARPDHRPVLADDGRIDLLVLQAMSEGEQLQEIAQQLAGAHPARFPTVVAALRYVADLSLKYGRR